MDMVSNLGIAYSTNIENAIGGAGIDFIQGNGLDNSLVGNAGDDTIYGGDGVDVIDGGDNKDFIDAGGTGLAAGAETLTGGAGDDTFVYSYAYLGTVITDFGADFATDVIDISKQLVHNFVDLMALASQDGADTVIDFGVVTPNNLHDTLTLQNFNIDDLDSGLFTFSESDISGPPDFKIIPNPAAGSTFYSTGAAFSDGFMVVETSLTTYDGQHALMAHRFDERGVETGTFQINTTAFTNSGLFARALTLANGNVVVVWMSDDTGGGGDFCFRARIFDENGVPVTATDFVVNSTPPVTQTSPNGWSMDVLDLVNSSSGNGFIVGWRKDVIPGDESYQTHYYERAFDNSGSPITDDIDVGAIGMPDVPGIPLNTALREIVLSSGKVLHWWTGTEQGDSTGAMKIMARFSGDDAYVVVGANDLQQLVSADELPDGNIVFNWSAGSRSGSSYFMTGAQAVILDSDLHGFVKPGTDAGETMTGGIYNDELYGRGGDDVLIGGRDADILDGGEGIDTVDYSASVNGVTIVLGSSLAQEGGHAQGDTFISIENIIGSGAGDSFFDTDAADNDIFGNFGADSFYMHAGNNTVDGGRGVDIIAYDNEITDFEFSYDPFNKIITVTPKNSDIPYGTNTVTNVERFRFGIDAYTLTDVLKRAGYNDDNHPATAVADAYRVDVGATYVRNAATGLLANDDIPDGGGTMVGVLWNGEYVMSVDDASFGKLTIADDGSFTYVAPALGIYTFEYRMEDVDGSWSTSTVTFTATLPPPDAVNDFFYVEADSTLTLYASEGLLANDDAAGGTASVIGLVNGDQLVHSLEQEGGTLDVNADGSLSFTAAAGFIGNVSFDYSLMSDSSVGDVAKAVFKVTNDNVGPLGTDKVITIKEDKAYTFEADDFGFRDGTDAFVSMKVEAILGDGTLSLDGTEVGANAEINVADFDKLVWTPGKDMHGEGLGGFSFRVRDDGGREGDGWDIGLYPNTILFDVVEVTDVFKGKKGKDNFVGTDDHDLFDGKAGNDTYKGNGGSDTFVFKTGYDKDTIKDFDGVGHDHDVIDLSSLTSIASFKDLKREHVEDHGKDIWIDGGKGDVLVIKGVDAIEKDWFEI